MPPRVELVNRLAHGHDLQREPCLEELHLGCPVPRQVQRDDAFHHARRGLGDDHTATDALAGLGQHVALHEADRLPDDAAAGVEPLHEIGFGTDHGAHREVGSDDLELDRPGDALRRAALERTGTRNPHVREL